MIPSQGYIVRTRDGRKYRIDGAASAEEARAAFIEQFGEAPEPTGKPVGTPIGGYQPYDVGAPGSKRIDEITPDYSGSDYLLGAARGAGLGAIMGLPFGGPTGSLTGAAGGTAGELAGMALEESGAGAGGQFGGSLAADIATSALTRRPSAGLVSRIPAAQKLTEKGVEYLGKGGAVKRFLGRNWAAEATGSAARRAGKLITDLPSPSPSNMDPAVEVAEQVRSSHQYMDDVYQNARKQAEKESLGSYGSTEKLTRKAGELLEGLEYMDEIPSVIRRAADLPDQITLQQAENIRKGVGSAYARGVVDRNARHYKEAAGLYGPLDSVLDDIAAQTPEGERAVEAVTKMREARKAMHRAAPESSLMHRYLIGQNRFDNAQKALDRIFSSDRAVAEVKLVRGMMRDVGEDIALRRAAVIHVLQRRLGMAANAVASSPQSGGAAIGKASSESAALTEILGERAFGNLMDILDDVATPGRGATRFSARMPLGREGSLSRLLLVLAGGAGAGAQISPEAGAAVLALGGVVEAFARQNGKEAVANLALAALTDPDIYRMVAMGASVNNAEAAAVRLGQTLVRRALFSPEELGGDG